MDLEDLRSKYPLEKCPFCGNAAALWGRNCENAKIYFVQCITCGARARGSEEMKEAIVRWNMRMRPDAEEEDRYTVDLMRISERLKKICKKLGIELKQGE